MGKEYSLEKKQEFTFDDFIKVDNRTIQRILRDVDSEILVKALLGSREMVKEHFFENMSQRAAGMLKEDMEYILVFESEEIEDAKQYILDLYDFESSWECNSVMVLLYMPGRRRR
jgi:flagellar motor switch protein FliG